MLPQEIIKKIRLINIKTKLMVDEMFSGEYHSIFKGRGIEFSEVREYTYGDDIRTIDWNVTARYGKPFVKMYEEERELSVIILFDVSSSTLFGSTDSTKRDVMVELSALFSFSAVENNDRVGAILFSDKIRNYNPVTSAIPGCAAIDLRLFDDRAEEASYIAKRASQFIASGRCPSEIVILLRGVKNCRDYEQALERQNIPALTIGGTGFYHSVFFY